MSYIKRKNSFYVYRCTVDGVVRYVGKGIGDRWLHCIQGKSTCKRLNRDLFAGKKLDVEIIHEHLSEDGALTIELDLIQSMPNQLYNTAGNQHPYKEEADIGLTKDSPGHLLFEMLQASIMREQETKAMIELERQNTRHSIWQKTLKLKKGKDDQKLTTYMLMLENRKLTQKISELQAQLTASQ